MPHEEYPCLVPYDAEARAEWTQLNAPRDEYAARLERARAEMAQAGYDALLVVGNGGDPANIQYLTNYVPHFGTTVLLLPLDGAAGEWMAVAAGWVLAVPIGGAFRGLLIGVAIVIAIHAARVLLAVDGADD